MLHRHLRHDKLLTNSIHPCLVRPKGLEPPRLSALDPKSSAATNYATAAVVKETAKIRYFSIIPCLENIFPLRLAIFIQARVYSPDGNKPSITSSITFGK